MLDQIKRKRLSMTQQFNNTRPRLKSSQKRKLIQANLQKFQKDVSESRSNSPFQSAQDFYSHKSSSILNQSPTMRDLINPFRKQSSQIQPKQEIQSPRFKQQEEKYQQNQLKNSSPQRKHEDMPVFQQKKQQNKQELGNSSLNNSSLLNNLLNRPQTIKQSETKPEKLQKHVSFGQNAMQNLSSSKSQKNDSKILHNNMQPQYQKNPTDTNELNFNYNQSNYGGSSNGSGILFTSQLRDYINRQKQPNTNPKIEQIQPITHAQNTKRKTQQSQNHTQTDKQIGESFLKIGEQELSSGGQSRKKLLHNQSGRSLAFSNQQSILKQSKINEHTAVQEIINKKLDQELVLEIDHFVKYKLKDIAHLYSDISHTKQIRTMVKDLKILHSILEFIRKRKYNLKRYYFDGMLILKEYKFEEVKNQIKADKHKKQMDSKILGQTFQSWRRIGIENQKKILYNNAKRQEKIKKNIYQVFKLIWFDSKVKRQVDLYYLSKIFSALRTAAAQSKKKSENLALKQYCKSLKRTYFIKIQEGVQVMKKQRLDQQLAEQHYQMTTLKKFFDSWLEQCDRSPQYVSLTMTSKNFFKQTLDNKWLGIKTVDFKQLKE